MNGLRAFFIGCLALGAGLLLGVAASLLTARPLPSEVAAGLRLWRLYGCEGCHALYGQGSMYASDLTGVAVRRALDDLRRLLASPEAVTANGRLMPPLGLAPAEAEALLAFFAWVSAQPPGDVWPPTAR